MSPNTPNDFIGSLVEMAEAYRELPKVQAELEQVRRDADVAHAMTADREEAILRYKAEIETLHSRIRTLEVDRDHAETMFLEADDRTARALDFIKATFGNAGSLIQALELPKPVEPQPMPPVEVSRPTELEELHTTQPVGQSEPFPSSPMEASSSQPETQHGSPEPSASPSPAPEVAPMQDPTSAPEHLIGSGTEPEAAHTDQSFSVPPVSPGRYSGKLYSEVSDNGQWPSKDEWLSEGGTLDNFYA